MGEAEYRPPPGEDGADISERLIVHIDGAATGYANLDGGPTGAVMMPMMELMLTVRDAYNVTETRKVSLVLDPHQTGELHHLTHQALQDFLKPTTAPPTSGN